MELKEFVKETLTQITIGVKEAQDECFTHGALINPMLSVKTCNSESYRHDGKDYPATSVKFKVGLSENSNSENKRGIGVFFGNTTVGFQSEKGADTQSTTSVEFSVTAVLPYINRQGKHVPLEMIKR